MDGTIEFDNVVELAQFLKAFTGSTAKFEVTYTGARYILTFKGGF